MLHLIKFRKNLLLLISLAFSTSAFSQYDSLMLDSLHEVVFDEVDSTGIFFPQPNTLNSGEVLTLYDEVFYEDDNNSAVKIDEWQDSLLGLTHIKYQQYYGDYLVEGAQFIEHSENGKVEFINGKVGEITPDHFSDGRLSKEQAWNRLQDSLRLDTHTLAYQIEDQEEQLKIDTDNPDATYHPMAHAELLLALKNWRNLTYLIPAKKYKLAWKFKILSISPTYYKAFYIDAQTGEIFKDKTLTRDNTTADIWYFGDQLLDTDWRGFPYNNHRLLAQDNTRNFETRDDTKVLNNNAWSDIDQFTNSNSYWGTSDREATSAHWFVQRSWDYFNYKHGRHGIDGSSLEIRIIPKAENYGQAKYYPMPYSGAPHYLEFGNIGSAYYARAIDIVAHEYSHGVINFTANLNGEDEPGALDESFADIFGYLIEYYARGASASLTVGSDEPGLPSRSMDDPKTDGRHPNQNCNGDLLGQPDTYMGNYWSHCPNYDNGGIHTNSGVQNKWFSLLVQGGSGTNDNNHSYYISPVTTENVGKIVYHTLTNSLMSSSQYIDARALSILAAKRIFGECSHNHIQVQNAWHAVGVGPPSTCGQTSSKNAIKKINPKIYPNPAYDKLTIKLNTEFHGKSQMMILNTNGAIVHERILSENQSTIDLSSFTSGVYFIKIINEHDTHTSKFIKVK